MVVMKAKHFLDVVCDAKKILDCDFEETPRKVYVKNLRREITMTVLCKQFHPSNLNLRVKLKEDYLISVIMLNHVEKFVLATRRKECFKLNG